MIHPGFGGASYSPNSLKAIRLLRKGCTNRPFFHIIVQEAKYIECDPVIEQIGNFDPLPNKYNEKLVAINFKRLDYWLQNNSYVTGPVSKLLGLAGYYPLHHELFQKAWENRKLIKDRLQELRLAAAEIQKSKEYKTSESSDPSDQS